MGCWDIFCFLCGNTCRNPKYTNEVFLQDIEYYESGKGDKNFKTYFKPIYETYKKNPKLFEKKIKLLEKNTKWLNNCTFLCANNKVQLFMVAKKYHVIYLLEIKKIIYI